VLAELALGVERFVEIVAGFGIVDFSEKFDADFVGFFPISLFLELCGLFSQSGGIGSE
jgi:hypothetical protein